MSHILHTYSPSLVSNIQRLSASKRSYFPLRPMCPVTWFGDENIPSWFNLKCPPRWVSLEQTGRAGWDFLDGRPVESDPLDVAASNDTKFQRIGRILSGCEVSEVKLCQIFNFFFFWFWFERYLVVFSQTRDPIDTLESSAYIDLISVACDCNSY